MTLFLLLNILNFFLFYFLVVEFLLFFFLYFFFHDHFNNIFISIFIFLLVNSFFFYSVRKCANNFFSNLIYIWIVFIYFFLIYFNQDYLSLKIKRQLKIVPVICNRKLYFKNKCKLFIFFSL
jgi:hypothetical protein